MNQKDLSNLYSLRLLTFWTSLSIRMNDNWAVTLIRTHFSPTHSPCTHAVKILSSHSSCGFFSPPDSLPERVGKGWVPSWGEYLASDFQGTKKKSWGTWTRSIFSRWGQQVVAISLCTRLSVWVWLMRWFRYLAAAGSEQGQAVSSAVN